MALQNQNGIYVRVTNVDILTNRVFIEKYRNAEIRFNTTEFDNIIPDSLHCGKLEEKLNTTPNTGCVKNDLITCGYLALKEEPPYNNSGEEQWIDC
jgi:hypothetical protein